jgi:hypothetical protein
MLGGWGLRWLQCAYYSADKGDGAMWEGRTDGTDQNGTVRGTAFLIGGYNGFLWHDMKHALPASISWLSDVVLEWRKALVCITRRSAVCIVVLIGNWSLW